MKYTVTKLDRRHNGYGKFKYHIVPKDLWKSDESEDRLRTLRNWCWATFGPASELEYGVTEDVWGWDTSYGKKRIYLKSDEELVLFNLKFAG